MYIKKKKKRMLVTENLHKFTVHQLCFWSRMQECNLTSHINIYIV